MSGKYKKVAKGKWVKVPSSNREGRQMNEETNYRVSGGYAKDSAEQVAYEGKTRAAQAEIAKRYASYRAEMSKEEALNKIEKEIDYDRDSDMKRAFQLWKEGKTLKGGKQVKITTARNEKGDVKNINGKQYIKIGNKWEKANKE